MDTYLHSPNIQPQTFNADSLTEKSTGGDTLLNSNIEVPFTQYQKMHNLPYTAKYFDIDNYEHLNDITDIDNVRAKINTIEDYIFSQIEKNSLEDNLKTYESLISRFIESLGIDENETTNSKFNKISKYIKILGKSRQPEQMERDLIKKQELIKQSVIKKEQELDEKIREARQKSITVEKTINEYKTKLLQKEKELDEVYKINKYYSDIISNYLK